jgi:hypothetical protein
MGFIFTKQTQFTEKYFNEYMETLRAVPKEELESKFKLAFGFYSNYNEFKSDIGDQNSPFMDKFYLARADFQTFIEAVLMKHCKGGILIDNEEEINNELQPVLEHMRKGDVLYYSMKLLKTKNF